MRYAAGILKIDLSALQENYKILCARLREGARCGAVLKANAYGLGAEPVSKALYAAGCRDFYVAAPEEGVALRAHLPAARIYILNGYYESAAGLYTEHSLTPVLGSFMEIEAYRKLSSGMKKPLPAWLGFNIRMNRLGLAKMETKKILQQKPLLDGIRIEGILSHFSCADIADHPTTALQYEIFLQIAAHFPGAEKSLANSSGIFRSKDYHFDLVRPGMALYGLNPAPETANPMRSVVTLNVPVMRTRIVYEGAQVGYGGTYKFEKDTPIAIVSAGYADGVFWSLSNRGAFYWNGIRCPIRGRVSMDMTAVDLSSVPKGERPKPGDFMELIGPHQTPSDLGQDAGSFDYEVLTSLGPRYKRVYLPVDMSQTRISSGKSASEIGAKPS